MFGNGLNVLFAQLPGFGVRGSPNRNLKSALKEVVLRGLAKDAFESERDDITTAAANARIIVQSFNGESSCQGFGMSGR